MPGRLIDTVLRRSLEADQWRQATVPCYACQGSGRLPKAKLQDQCPSPLITGWTIEQCFRAKKCSCAQGAALGYEPEPHVDEDRTAGSP